MHHGFASHSQRRFCIAYFLSSVDMYLFCIKRNSSDAVVAFEFMGRGLVLFMLELLLVF